MSVLDLHLQVDTVLPPAVVRRMNVQVIVVGEHNVGKGDMRIAETLKGLELCEVRFLEQLVEVTGSLVVTQVVHRLECRDAVVETHGCLV